MESASGEGWVGGEMATNTKAAQHSRQSDDVGAEDDKDSFHFSNASSKSTSQNRFKLSDANAVAEDEATTKLVDILVECLQRLVKAESLRPHLFANVSF